MRKLKSFGDMSSSPVDNTIWSGFDEYMEDVQRETMLSEIEKLHHLDIVLD